MSKNYSVRERTLIRLYVLFVHAVQHNRLARLIRALYAPVGRYRRRSTASALPTPTEVPKILWLYWHQGEVNAPRLVAQCLQTWRDSNPTWDVRVLDDETVREEVPVDDLPSDISLQALSDVIRLRLLRKYGGVWVDATAYSVRPLDDWLPQMTGSGFFAFTLPAPDRLIGSWFLAACPGSPLIERWDSAATLYWHIRRRADAYFWVHYLFEFLTMLSPTVDAIWRATPTVDSQDCWRVFHVLRTEQQADEYRAIAHKSMADGAPFQRLSHKFDMAELDAHDLMDAYLHADREAPPVPKEQETP